MDIQIENLSKRYGPQKAVDQLSFQVLCKTASNR